MNVVRVLRSSTARSILLDGLHAAYLSSRQASSPGRVWKAQLHGAVDATSASAPPGAWSLKPVAFTNLHTEISNPERPSLVTRVDAPPNNTQGFRFGDTLIHPTSDRRRIYLLEGLQTNNKVWRKLRPNQLVAFCLSMLEATMTLRDQAQNLVWLAESRRDALELEKQKELKRQLKRERRTAWRKEERREKQQNQNLQEIERQMEQGQLSKEKWLKLILSLPIPPATDWEQISRRLDARSLTREHLLVISEDVLELNDSRLIKPAERLLRIIRSPTYQWQAFLESNPRDIGRMITLVKRTCRHNMNVVRQGRDTVPAIRGIPVGHVMRRFSVNKPLPNKRPRPPQDRPRLPTSFYEEGKGISPPIIRRLRLELMDGL